LNSSPAPNPAESAAQPVSTNGGKSGKSELKQEVAIDSSRSNIEF